MSKNTCQIQTQPFIYRLIFIVGINFVSIISLVTLNQLLHSSVTFAANEQTYQLSSFPSNVESDDLFRYDPNNGRWVQECTSSKFVVYTAGLRKGDVITNPQFIPIESQKIAPNSPLIVQVSGKFNELPLPSTVSVALDNDNGEVISNPEFLNDYGYSFITAFHELDLASLLSVQVDGSSESLQTVLGTAVYISEVITPTENWYSFGEITNVFSYSDVNTHIIEFNELLYQTDLHLSFVILDDQKENGRKYQIAATANGVTGSFTSNDGVQNQELIEVANIELTNVPTGTSQLSLTVDTSNKQESIILSGINVNYLCQESDHNVYLPIILKPVPIFVDVTPKYLTSYVGFPNTYEVRVTSEVTLTDVTLINQLSDFERVDSNVLSAVGASCYPDMYKKMVTCSIQTLGPDTPFILTIPTIPLTPTINGFMRSYAFESSENAGGEDTATTTIKCEEPNNNGKPWESNNNFNPGQIRLNFNYCGYLMDPDETSDGKKRTPDYNDYYTFTIPSPGTIKIAVTATNAFTLNTVLNPDQKIHLALYNANGERKAYTKQKSCREILYKVSANNSFPKLFFLRVYRYHPSTMQYVLKVEFHHNVFNLNKDSECK